MTMVTWRRNASATPTMMPAPVKRRQLRARRAGIMNAPAAPPMSSNPSEPSGIHGTTSHTPSRSAVASPPISATAANKPMRTLRQYHRCVGICHIVAIVTAAHMSQERIFPVPRYSSDSRKIRSASTRSTCGPRYSPSCTSPSWSTAAGRNTPLRGTSQVNTLGTEARSVRNAATSAGTMNGWAYPAASEEIWRSIANSRPSILKSSNRTAPPVSTSENRDRAPEHTSAGLPRGGEGSGHDGFHLPVGHRGKLARKCRQGRPGKLCARHVDEREVHRVRSIEKVGGDVCAHEGVRTAARRCDDDLLVRARGNCEAAKLPFLARGPDRSCGKFVGEPVRELRQRDGLREIPHPAPAAVARYGVHGGKGEGGLLVWVGPAQRFSDGGNRSEGHDHF